MGDVDLLELTTATVTRLESAITSLLGLVKVVDVLDVSDEEALRKNMGMATKGVRICFPDNAVLTSEPGMNSVMIFGFHFLVIVLYRNVGDQFTRLSSGPSPALFALAKDVIAALEGQTLGILNQGGLSCGPAGIISRGSSLQAMQFTVTARSRERRS